MFTSAGPLAHAPARCVKGHVVFFFKPCNSPLLCSSVALPLARWDREMPVLGFMQTLLCSESSRTNVTVCVLSTLSNTATCFSSFNSSTFLFRSPLLHFPHLYPHLLVFLSLSLSFPCSIFLSFTRSSSFNLWESRCLQQLNQHSSSSASHVLHLHFLLFCISSLPRSLPHWRVPSSGHSWQRQWLVPTLTSHHFTWATSPGQINLITSQADAWKRRDSITVPSVIQD